VAGTYVCLAAILLTKVSARRDLVRDDRPPDRHPSVLNHPPQEAAIPMTDTTAFALGQEYPPENEALLIQQVADMSRAAMERKPHPPTRRDQHPKSHGYLEAEFIIGDESWVRFSNGNSDRGPDGDFLPDTVGDARGIAIKLMGVEGTMAIPGSPHDGEQDFVMMNHPVFFVRDVQGYVDFFPVVDAMKAGIITFNPDGTPKDLPEDLKAHFWASAYALPFVREITSKVVSSPLEINYWSATPYRLGPHAIKFSVAPRMTGAPFNPETAADPTNYLREAMTQHLAEQDAYFDFQVQLQTDATKMPVEDPTIAWDEAESPFITIATLRIPPQDFNTAERKRLDETQSFSPWHSLVEHHPLGGVNRARKMYAQLAQRRNQINRDQECG
jgi:hypothetical protein